jgi:hypothetical protein
MSKIDELDYKNFKILFNRLVPFDSVYPKVFIGSVYCPFHRNTRTPSAKFYLDEDGIIRLNCFTEHTQYTAFDYVKLIKGVNPFAYLKKLFNDIELDKMIKLAKDANIFDYRMDDDKLYFIHNSWVDSLEEPVVFIDTIYKGYNLKELDNGKS